VKYESLMKTMTTLREENDALQQKVVDLEARLAQYESSNNGNANNNNNGLKQSLQNAQLIDAIVNG